MHDQRAGEAHALPHAAGELARIGRLETVESDQIDRREGALADLRARQILRLQAERDVLEHREPGKQREALKHHRDTARRPGQRLPEVAHLPGARLRKARDQAQQRRFARSGAAQQSHDLPLAQLEVHALEHQQFLAVGLGEGLTYVRT